MNERFQSAADICRHINAMPDMSASVAHVGRQMDAGRVLSDLFYVNVSLRGHMTMWRIDAAKAQNGEETLSVSKIYGKPYPAATRTQLAEAMNIMTLDLTR